MDVPSVTITLKYSITNTNSNDTTEGKKVWIPVVPRAVTIHIHKISRKGIPMIITTNITKAKKLTLNDQVKGSNKDNNSPEKSNTITPANVMLIFHREQ